MGEVAIKPEHLPIYRLEQALLTLPQVEIPVDHQFCSGVYARTVTIPAGTLVTGAIHKGECFFVVRTGSILITTNDEPIKAEAGYMAVTAPESKRVGFAITDAVVTTFHTNPKELRDPDEIWDEITIPPPANLLDILNQAELEDK